MEGICRFGLGADPFCPYVFFSFASLSSFHSSSLLDVSFAIVLFADLVDGIFFFFLFFLGIYRFRGPFLLLLTSLLSRFLNLVFVCHWHGE